MLLIESPHDSGTDPIYVNEAERIKANDQSQIPPDQNGQSYYHNTFDQTRDIVHRVLNSLPPKTTAEDSYETMKLIFAAELSADEKPLVRLDEPDFVAVAA